MLKTGYRLQSGTCADFLFCTIPIFFGRSAVTATRFPQGIGEFGYVLGRRRCAWRYCLGRTRCGLRGFLRFWPSGSDSRNRRIDARALPANAFPCSALWIRPHALYASRTIQVGL